MKALLVEVARSANNSRIEEFKELAKAAGYEIVGILQQIRNSPDPAYYLGKGKAEDLAEMAKSLKPDKIIFNKELKPNQIINLENITKTEVIDRIQLILEIFTKRAGTKEAKLQIELARLRYLFPKLKMYVKYAKREEFPGFHGPGYYQTAKYERMIKKRIAKIERELEKIRNEREERRKIRRELGFSLVALAGYSNAGKSTLLNRLTKSNVPADDRLFTTLGTYTRFAYFNGKKVLISDTIGFIENLPHLVIEAFKSTLEEITLADLIILVVDASEPLHEIERKIETANKVLEEVGATGKPILMALNKIDKISSKETKEKVSKLEGLARDIVPISALHGYNIDRLSIKAEQLLPKYVKIEAHIPLKQDVSLLVSHIYNRGNVKQVEYFNDEIKMQFEVLPHTSEYFRKIIENAGGTLEIMW